MHNLTYKILIKLVLLNYYKIMYIVQVPYILERRKYS